MHSSAASFEGVVSPADASFALMTYDNPTFERGWHFHPEAELTLILESSGRRFVGDHIGDFGPGDLVLLGPGLPHAWRNQGPPRSGGPRARSLCIQFPARWFDARGAPWPELREVMDLLDRAGRGLCFTGPVRAEAGRMMEALPGLHGLRRLTAFLEILQVLAEAPGLEPLASPGFTPMVDDCACERVRRIQAHVFAHFRSEIDHGELARLACLTPCALSRFFHRTTGRTITEFVHEVRVAEAARLLIDTDSNISEIAFATGFGNLSHFNETFRRLKAVNPTRYRELHRRL